MAAQRAITAAWLHRLGIPATATVVELGCGFGILSDVHTGYIGLEFAFPPLSAMDSPVPKVNADMQQLPFRTGSIDFLFSWAALEHVPNPETVLEEIQRVIRVGGVVLLAPAWNVRPWAADALPTRRYSELSLTKRVLKLLIPLRNSLVWKALSVLPRRLWSEIKIANDLPVPFIYRRLSPNLETYTYTDCDAFTSMDSHAGIAFFRSRDWAVLSHPSLLRRLMARHEPVVVTRTR
jgi:SAM-dependent methyltransferase